MAAGVSLNEWYDTYTFGEINTIIKAYSVIHKQEEQEKAIHNYLLADLIGASVARLLDKKAKYPDIKSVYPQLFNNLEPADSKLKQQDWRIMKARLLAMAEGRKDYTSKERSVDEPRRT